MKIAFYLGIGIRWGLSLFLVLVAYDEAGWATATLFILGVIFVEAKTIQRRRLLRESKRLNAEISRQIERLKKNSAETIDLLKGQLFVSQLSAAALSAVSKNATYDDKEV